MKGEAQDFLLQVFFTTISLKVFTKLAYRIQRGGNVSAETCISNKIAFHTLYLEASSRQLPVKRGTDKSNHFRAWKRQVLGACVA